MLFAWQAQGFRYVSKCVAGAGVREGCKNVGRRGGFEEAPKRCVSRGRGKDFVLCDVDVWSLRRRIRGRVATFMSRKWYFAVIILRLQLQDFLCLGSTFSWQAQYFWSIHLKIVKTYWNSEVKRAVNMSFLKEVSQKCFVFDVRSFIFEGSLAEKLRFWASKLHFWRKSRRNASVLGFKASILKEVSQKSFVFELQSFIFEGSLAQKLRFWFSKLQFWRKSRRKASFLSFKVSFLKEVSHKSFVFDFQSFNFEGSLAQKLRFSASKLHFWRKSRTKASFLIRQSVT